MDAFRESCPAAGRLSTVIEIPHGPPDLLRDFLLFADREASERGVALGFASFDELVAANEANSTTWRPLVPIFNPALSGVTEQTGFALLGRNKEGEIVATQAARIYDWLQTDLEREARSLRMFYADTIAAAARGDRCDVTAPVAKTIKGRVVFSGAGWYRPDFRGVGLATILPRISRAYAFARWKSDYTISMMGEKVVAGGMARRCGYTNVEPDGIAFVASPLGELRGALVWTLDLVRHRRLAS